MGYLDRMLFQDFRDGRECSAPTFKIPNFVFERRQSFKSHPARRLKGLDD